MKVGMKNLVYAPLAADDKKYTKDPTRFSGAISLKSDPDKSDSKTYYDDELKDSDSSVTSSKLNMVISGDEDVVLAEVLGSTYSETEGTTVKNTDTPIFIGIGYVVTVRVDKTTKYKSIVFPKVKLEAPSDEAKTKEEKVEYQTVTLDGTAYFNGDGVLQYKSPNFATLAEAITYITGKMVKETTGA